MNNSFFIEDFIFVLVVLVLIIGAIFYIYFRESSKKKKPSEKARHIAAQSQFLGGADDDNDITNYRTEDIAKVGLFHAYERKMEYRSRGKSPSGVIDGVYNDMYREDGRPYNDMDRDWDADA